MKANAMPRILYSIIIVSLVLASCAGLEAERAELSVLPAVPGTKGFVADAVLVDDDGAARDVVLSARLRAQNGRSENYFSSYVFSRNGGGSAWRHDPPVYMPVGGTLDVIGYSSSAPFLDADVTWGFPDVSERMRLAFDEGRLTDDVLFGAAYGVSSAPAGVMVPMLHSQAWVEVRMARREGAGDAPVLIHAVMLSSVYTEGVLTVESRYGNPDGAWDCRRYEARDLVLPDGGTVYGHDVTTAGFTLRVLLPEQEQTALTVDYEVDGEARTQTYTLPRAWWVMGRRYIYELVFSPVESGSLSMTVAVGDWTSGTPFRQDI